MKKNIFSVSIIFILLICTSSVKYYGLDYGMVSQVQQKYDTWCFFAVCEMQYGYPQCYAASRYQEYSIINNHEEWLITDCCSGDNGEYCNPIYFKDVIPFYNEYGYENFSRWNSLHNKINYYTDEFQGSRVLPRLGIIYEGRDFHTVWLFRVIIEINPRTLTYTYQEIFVDPWTGAYDSITNYAYSTSFITQVYILD